MSERPAESEVPWHVRDVLFVFLLTLLVGFGAALLVAALVEAGHLPTRAATALLLPLSPVLLGMVCLMYVTIRHPRTTRRLFGSSKAPGREVGIGVMLGGVAMLAQLLLLAAAAALFDVPVQEAQAPLREAALDPVLRPFLILGAVVLAPIAEELFFRGLAYQALRKRAGVTGGAVLSAAFFSAAHLSAGVPVAANLVLFTIIFLLGLVLAILFERRQSLIAPISLHATFNLLAVGALLAEAARTGP